MEDGGPCKVRQISVGIAGDCGGLRGTMYELDGKQLEGTGVLFTWSSFFFCCLKLMSTFILSLYNHFPLYFSGEPYEFHVLKHACDTHNRIPILRSPYC